MLLTWVFIAVAALLYGQATARVPRRPPPPQPRWYGHGPHGAGFHPDIHYHYYTDSEVDPRYAAQNDQGGKSDDSDESEESEESTELEHEEQDDRIWKFQIGDDFEAYEYIDPEDGYLKGFSIDLILAVCRHAGKRCYWVMDKFRNCWETDGWFEFPGKGLQGGFYDGCFNLMPSPARQNSFNFTIDHSKSFKVGVFFREGDASASTKLTGRKIGFVDGWVLSQRCLERQGSFEGNVRGLYTPMMYETFDEMNNALKDSKIDAAVMPVPPNDLKRNGLIHIDPVFKCSNGGLSVMAPYGSDLFEWWNKAMVEMRISGEFHQLCEQGSKTHAHRGSIMCN